MTKYAVFDYLYNEIGVFSVDDIASIGPSTNSLCLTGTAITFKTGRGSTVKQTPKEVLDKLNSLGWKDSKTDSKVTLTGLDNKKIELSTEGMMAIIGFRPKHDYTSVFYNDGSSYSVKETAQETFNIFSKA